MFTQIKIGQNNVKIKAYSPEIYNKLLSKQFTASKNDSIIDKEIHIFKNQNLFVNNIKYDEYARKKSNNWALHIYHDIVKGLIIYSNCENKYLIIGLHDYDCACLLKALILKIYSDQFTMSSIAFHASSFELDNHAYAFLGNGNTGKSTILFSCANQLKDIKVINDDFIMCENANDNVIINSLPLKCAIREASLKHLKIKNDYIFQEKTYLGDGDQYYIDVNDIFGVPYTTGVKLKYIFFFSTSSTNNTLKLNKITDKKLIAKLITINMTSFKLKVDERTLLEILNKIINQVNVYELLLPFDMTNFPQALLHKLKEQS